MVDCFSRIRNTKNSPGQASKDPKEMKKGLEEQASHDSKLDLKHYHEAQEHQTQQPSRSSYADRAKENLPSAAITMSGTKTPMPITLGDFIPRRIADKNSPPKFRTSKEALKTADSNEKAKAARDNISSYSSRTIVLDIRPLPFRELAIPTANCHSCGEQNL
jgi:hypothetical protein